MRIIWDKIPLRFLFTGLILLLVGSIIGILLKNSSLPVSAHAHIMLAGFVTFTIIGAMYQIVPTVVGQNLRSGTIAEITFWLSIVGFLGLIYSFFVNYSLLPMFGAIFFLGILLFAILIVDTVLRAPEWYRMSPAVWFFFSAIIFLLAGIIYAIYGITAGGFKVPAHAHLLAGGWVVITTMGGLYELLPMLSLKKLFSRSIAGWQFWLSVIGIILIYGAFVYDRDYLVFGAAVFGISFYAFFYNMVKTYFSPPDQEIDISARFFIYGLGYGFIGVTLGLLMLIYPLKFLHVHMILAGWITFTIIGAEYHIFPMIIWMEKYSQKLGVEDVPMIKDMYNKKLADILLYMSNAGIIIFLLSPLSRYAIIAGGIVLFIAFLAFTVEIILISKR